MTFIDTSSTDVRLPGDSTDPRPVDPPLLEVSDVSFEYSEGVPVLQNLNFDVPEGSIIGMVGPSGCGKSTLLSLVAGLSSPTSGKLKWQDDPHVPPRHPLTMLFQKDTLLPWQTVETNIALHYKFRKDRRAKADRRARIAELLDLAGLTGSEKSYPYQLSGGMKRRTAFLAAVAPGPRTLLLDEPFSALDEPTRVGIHEDIFKIVKEAGITVLLITHDIGEAISLSDTVMVLSSKPAGVVESFDIPFGTDRNMMELREQPAFLDLYGRIWESLSDQIVRSQVDVQKDKS
jgi:NitT/TauT family transport system ATP-binding protein